MHQATPTVSPPEDTTRWAFGRVVPPSRGEIALLHRIDAGRAQRRLTDYIAEYGPAMDADHEEMRREADPDSEHVVPLVHLAKRKPGLKRQLDEYRAIVQRHSRAYEAAWDEHQRQLNRASASSFRRAVEAHNADPHWLGLGALQRAALERRPRAHAAPRLRSPARARARRPAARRAAGARSSQDPGDDGDPERPPPRGELRHVSHALADLLEELRLEGMRR